MENAKLDPQSWNDGTSQVIRNALQAKRNPRASIDATGQADTPHSRGTFLTANSDDDIYEFEKLCAPLVEFLQTKHHPHMRVIIDWDRATLVEEQMSVPFPVPD